MAVLDDVQRAKAQLREAMLSVEAWPSALAAIASACGARSGQLIGMDQTGTILTHFLTGVDPEEFDQISAFGVGDPVRNPRLRIGQRAAVLVPEADQNWIDADARRKSPIYREIYDRLDLSFNCQTVLVREPNLLLRASVTKSSGQGPLSSEEMRVFTSLAPHIQAAARVHVSLARTASLSAMGMLDAMDLPGLLLDASGGVIAVSAAADVEISNGRLLRLRDRRLHTLVAEDKVVLDNAISAALSSGSGRPGACIVEIRSRSGRYDWALDVIALASSGHLPGLAPAVLIVARPANVVRSPAELAREAWGLSAAEAEIAVRLAAGETLNAIGEARGVSRTTVRSQLQSIYAKVGVHRQAAVVAAILALKTTPDHDLT